MLKVEIKDDIYIALFENINRFNALITEPVKEQLNGLYTKPNTKVILDLGNISFIDSSGFGVFLSVMKTANLNYGQFKICNIRKEVIELFKLLQLHNIFELYNSLDECINSFKK